MCDLVGTFFRKERDLFIPRTIKSELTIAFSLIALVPVLAINLYLVNIKE